MFRPLLLRPFEKITIVYLLLLSVVILIFRTGVESWYNFLLFHALAIGLICFLNKLNGDRHKLIAIIRDWYIYPAYLFLYSELGHLNKMVFNKFFNETVIGFEQSLFGSQPSTWLAEYFSSPFLTEIVNIGYFFYYPMVPLVGIVLYLRSDKTAFYHFFAGITLAFLTCYFVYVFFPVQGPCYIFPEASVDRLQGYFITDIVIWMHHGGAVSSCAFPSSHVAVAVVALMFARRYTRALFWGMLPFVILLTIGTFYGKYHFVVDALSGLVFGILLYWVASQEIFIWSEPERDLIEMK